jgi:DNA-binding NtrC family response regulator
MIELDDLPESLHTAVAMTPAPVPAASPVSAPAASPSDFLAALSVSVAAPDVGPQATQGPLPAARSTLAEAQDQTERALITQALERNSYNRLRAAADLGISRMTLYKKLHKYGLMGAV